MTIHRQAERLLADYRTGDRSEGLRQRMLAWLAANDPDGEYGDDDCLREGWDPLQVEDCAAMIMEGLETGAVAGLHDDYRDRLAEERPSCCRLCGDVLEPDNTGPLCPDCFERQGSAR